MNCILGIRSFWANIHLSVSVFHVCSFVIRLPHSGWYFLVASICLRISWIHCFNSWVVLHCINLPHFLYPFLYWRTSGFFPATGYYNKAAMNIVEHVSLLHVGASSVCMPRSGIAGSSGSAMSNFLRNCPSHFQRGCISLQSHQHWRSVPLSPHPSQHLL